APVITKIKTPPGRVAMREDWDQSVKSLGDMPGMVDTVRQAREEIQRPKYYDTIAGPEWKEPVDMLAAGDKNSKLNAIAKYRRDLDDNKKEIERIQRMYDEAPEPGAKAPEKTGSGGGGGGGKGGTGGGGRTIGGGRDQNKAPDTAKGDKIALG